MVKMHKTVYTSRCTGVILAQRPCQSSLYRFNFNGWSSRGIQDDWIRSSSLLSALPDRLSLEKFCCSPSRIGGFCDDDVDALEKSDGPPLQTISLEGCLKELAHSFHINFQDTAEAVRRTCKTEYRSQWTDNGYQSFNCGRCIIAPNIIPIQFAPSATLWLSAQIACWICKPGPPNIQTEHKKKHSNQLPRILDNTIAGWQIWIFHLLMQFSWRGFIKDLTQSPEINIQKTAEAVRRAIIT